MDSQPTSPKTPPRTPANSSPMSLYRLGITSSPLSPLRRHFSSPIPRTPRPSERDGHNSEDGEDDAKERELDDAARDSTDVLVERLSDLAQRLSAGSVVHDGHITSLHAKVDEMEGLLAGGGSRDATPKMESSSSPPPTRVRESARNGKDAFWRPPLSPSWVLKRHLSDMSEAAVIDMAAKVARGAPVPRVFLEKPISSAPAVGRTGEGIRPKTPKVTPELAGKLVMDAEELHEELSAVLQNLHDRREESDHLHTVLVERAEHAARRVVELQARVDDLEDEVQGNESELSFLRLRLKSIEVQCLQYVPDDADPDLSQSIRNWKKDWADLRNKWAARRRVSHGTSSVGSLGTPGSLY